MKERHSKKEHTPSAEPVGIVISQGRWPETAPVFSAYLYAPDPEQPEAGAALATA